jgi:dTDP-4-dehydrorhamnose reductase
LRVLVTGANGMLARAAIEHCRKIGDEVFAYSREQLDIVDREAVSALFERDCPQAVLNCAAYTNVDGAETNSALSFAANSTGVENLALAARAIGAVFITVSTDYVFDGKKTGFYTQADAPNPQGVYGKSKLEGERLAQKANPAAIIVRSGWIFGRGGANFLSVISGLLKEGKSLKAISDQYGTPTYAHHLAARMRDLAALKLPSDALPIFHVTNAGAGASYEGFARKAAELLSLPQALVAGIPGDSLQRPAPRPANSRLACLVSEKLGLEPLPHWEDALRDFLQKESEADTPRLSTNV